MVPRTELALGGGQGGRPWNVPDFAGRSEKNGIEAELELIIGIDFELAAGVIDDELRFWSFSDFAGHR